MVRHKDIKYVRHNDTAETFESVCKKHGLKITPQRMIIYKELSIAKDHPSVEVLYERVRKILPNISFDTVYRTTLSFADIGLVNIVEGWGDPKRFDPNINQHHHFRCLECHRIIDFSYSQFDSLKVPKDLYERFEIVRKRVVLEGICEDCKKKNRGKRRK